MKRFLSILIVALIGMSFTAMAEQTIPWEEHFDTDFTVGGEDGFIKERFDNASTSSSWYWQWYQQHVRVRSGSNGMDRAFVWPQMNFEAGKCYYAEFSVVVNALDDCTVTLYQLAGTTTASPLATIGSTLLPNRKRAPSASISKPKRG